MMRWLSDLAKDLSGRMFACGVAIVPAQAVIGGTPAAAGNITDIIETPIPQYTTQTCQSYSAAVLLAFQNDPAFPIDTLAALRDAEVAIRTQIEALAMARNHVDDNGNLAPTHDDVMDGFKAYTSNLYTLDRTTVSDILGVGKFVGNETGITDAGAVPFPILPSAVQQPVMISVKRLGQNVYKAGHLVTVFGVSGPPDSNRQYLILNSAVKIGQGAALFCDPNEPATQTSYGALTSWTNDLEITDYSGSYYAFTAIKN
jgi:hypothetical protein